MVSRYQNKKKVRIVLLERIFSNYRKPVYDLIGQHMNIRLLHGNNNSGIGVANTNYSHKIPFIQFGKNETNLILFPLIKILTNRPQVVISDFALGMINLPFIILFCKILNIKFAFWSHAYNRKTGFNPDKSWKDRYRLFLMKRVDALIFYSEEGRKVMKNYIPEERIFIAQNTLDTRALTKIRDQLQEEGVAAIKKRLNIHHDFNLIFIGRMLEDKKPDYLVDIYESLKNKYQLKVGIHFVGEGTLLPLIKKRVTDNHYEDDFYFHGSIYQNEKSGALLYLSDLMIMPGYLGLSVNHAFCFDCPVVSFKEINGFPPHSPEIEYVIHNKTGFLLEEQTPQAISEIVDTYLKNKTLQKEMASNIRFMVKEKFPIERMVEGVIRSIQFMLKQEKS